MPTLKTSESDDFYVARALYGFKDRDATKRSLDKVQELSSAIKNPDGIHVYNWLETKPSSHPEERRQEGREVEGRRVLGIVTLTRDSLEVECFSEERLSRLRELLERRFTSNITFLADFSIDLKTALKQLRDRPKKVKSGLPKGEARRVMEQRLNHYYLEKWVNSKIPALSSKTPMQAMKTEEGKASLTQLLNELQNLEERKRKTGEPYFDVKKLRSKLGLPTRRDTVDDK